jgi:hypothetical protein
MSPLSKAIETTANHELEIEIPLQLEKIPRQRDLQLQLQRVVRLFPYRAGRQTSACPKKVSE